MKLKVKVDDQLFEVEIGSLRERPILAKVDGEIFEVWPETRQVYTNNAALRSQALAAPPEKEKSLTPPRSLDAERARLAETQTAPHVLRAPIPGIITAVSVQAGDVVQAGQELCKLEAMKMNNSIRASRSGKIASIRVSVGQTVKHSDVLFEFSD